MRIFIPSYGRAGDVTTLGWFPSAKLVVPESQAEKYRKHYGDSVLAIPDDQDGNIARKRNAILGLMKDNELAWIADDDLRDIIRIKGIVTLEPEEILERHWRVMNDYGAAYGGFAISDDPAKYAEYAPFSLTKPSYGAVCIRKVEAISYDEQLGRHEDADYFLKVLHSGGRVLRDNRYFFKFACNKDGKRQNKGGISGDEDQFDEALKKIQKRWGSVIKVKNGKMMGINSTRKGS